MVRRRKAKKPKLPKYVLVDRATQEGAEVYRLITDTVKQHHEHLRNASIAAAWMVGKKADRDGHLVLGMMRKTSELDRQFAEHDLCLLLNRESWRVFSPAQRAALVDHELCHADLRLDPTTLEPVEDAHGKKLYRIRKHDIEEFSAVVRRHGIWKSDLEVFYDNLEKGRQAQLFRANESKPPKGGGGKKAA